MKSGDEGSGIHKDIRMSQSADTHADELEYAVLQRIRERADPAERDLIDTLVDRNAALERRALIAEQECERLREEVEAARKCAEESVIRERRRAAGLEALMEAVPATIFVAIDPECRTIFGSGWTYDLLRLPQGSNLSMSAPGDERQTRFRAMKDGVEIPPDDLPMQKAAATGQPMEQVEFDLVFDDGTVRHLLGNAVPLRDENGRTHGAVGAFIDITGQKFHDAIRQQAYAQIEHNMEQFAILGDHVRHPLQVILARADLLGDDEAAKSIREQVRRVNDIVRQLDEGWVESRAIREFLQRNEMG
jgi:PAS domain-containing protein